MRAELCPYGPLDLGALVGVGLFLHVWWLLWQAKKVRPIDASFALTVTGAFIVAFLAQLFPGRLGYLVCAVVAVVGGLFIRLAKRSLRMRSENDGE